MAHTPQHRHLCPTLLRMVNPSSLEDAVNHARHCERDDCPVWDDEGAAVAVVTVIDIIDEVEALLAADRYINEREGRYVGRPTR